MKIIVFTGTGISRESGIATFRDLDGRWANNRIEEPAPVGVPRIAGEIVEQKGRI